MKVSSPSGTVWVVDDNRKHAEVCRLVLAVSFDVVVFHDGAVVLEQLANGRVPDALVLDWVMPDISGADLLAALRENHTLTALPVIVVTAERSRDSAARAIRAGANDYIEKPFSAEELTARVDTLVRGKRQLDELRLAQQQLREDVVFRERLLGVLAHDLRQPLHLLTMGIEVMSSNLSPESRARAKDRMSSAATRMTRMIEQLLDFTRARVDGRFPIERQTFRLDEAARTIVAEVAETTRDHELHVVIEGDTTGAWDEVRVGQVIANLLANAIAHGERPSDILVSLRGQEDAVVLAIRNRGKPIEPEQVATLFEPFRKGASSAGLGLGLYIVKEIVSAHDGSVHVESNDSGTTFEVMLPRAARR